MDARAALTGQWRRSDPYVDDLDTLAASVLDLTACLGTAVPSFLGLTVTTNPSTSTDTQAGTVTLTAVGAGADRPAITSLGFSVLHRGTRPVRLTLYAHQAGALVDLDADLAYVSRPGHQPNPGAAPTVVDVRLDHDLPAPTLAPGLIGWEGRSPLDRAEGVLIDQGVHPDNAASQLRLRATAAGLDLHAYAHQVLAALPPAADR